MLLKRNPIGNTGLLDTEIGFGAAPLGGMPETYGHDVDEETARATVRAIFDGPVNLLDVSRNYGAGRAEARIGAVIRERGGLPKDFVLSTKLDRDMETGRFDASRARKSFEVSLTALGVDKVGVLHLHDPEYAADLSEVTSKGGALDELFRMKEEGLAASVGLAMGRMALFTSLLHDWSFDVVMNHNRFTLLNRSAGPAFENAHRRGMAVSTPRRTRAACWPKEATKHGALLIRAPATRRLRRSNGLKTYVDADRSRWVQRLFNSRCGLPPYLRRLSVSPTRNAYGRR